MAKKIIDLDKEYLSCFYSNNKIEIETKKHIIKISSERLLESLKHDIQDALGERQLK